jgi:hypothetical protein
VVSLAKNEIALFGRVEPVQRYEVWFQSPWGLIPSRSEAVEHCLAHDMDPESVLIPVSVAVGPDNLYEVVGR